MRVLLFPLGSAGDVHPFVAIGRRLRDRGHDVEHLRMAMPISTREGKSSEGNAFAPTRTVVATIADPRARFDAIREQLAVTKAERSLRLVQSLAGLANLLPAHLDGPRDLAGTTGYVAKPLLGREGAGVTVHEKGAPAEVRDEPCCYQQLAPLPTFDGNHVVLGAWVVEDEPAGLGIRESSGLITDEYARFLPHVIL